MPIAFLLLNVKPGREEEVLSSLRGIKEVRKPSVFTGFMTPL